MVVQHNITSMNANRNLGIVGGNLQKASEKLSSGYRINRAGDDAAGLAISEKMRSQVRGLQRASDNAADGISAIQTAEGVMDAQHQIAQRARELLVQYKNSAVLTSTDKAKISTELSQLVEEFSRIVTQTEFNKVKVGSISGNLQVGANSGQTISIKASFVTTLTTTSIANIDNIIGSVSTNRATLGAKQNRLEYTIKVLDNSAENLSAAESRIRDTDMAEEMTKFSKENILQQAATSMLSQANQANQGVLSLLQ
ncbi:MAG: flagellin [Lachnospiraceae bacterium]|nr:flagellin [Lachnospiraceae bacterium]